MLGLALAGCSMVTGVMSGDKPSRDETSGEVLEQGTESAFDLEVGDCVADGTDDAVVFDLNLVPCDESHSDEAYYAFDLNQDEFPGDEAIIAAADERCIAEFPNYVGTEYEDSALTYWPMTPTEDGWRELGDREVMCMLYDESGPLAGSAKGSGL